MNGNEQQIPRQPLAQEAPSQVGVSSTNPLRETIGLRRKSPVLATILSSMPGLGQVYVGYYQQGFLCVAVAAACITILNVSSMTAWEPFFGMFLAFFWIFNMIDANRRALHYNRVAAGLGGEEVPDGFSLPGTGGSVAGGVILVTLGMLLFLNLKFDVSMAWLEDWWPLFLVAGGVWLIIKARREQS